MNGTAQAVQGAETGITLAEMETKNMDYVIGKVRKIIYSSPTNLYKVFLANDLNGKEMKLVGNVDVEENINYTFYGEWGYDKRKMKQFQSSICEVYKGFKMDEDSIIGYLTSPLFKGIGKSKAIKIYEKFGLDSISVVENQTEKLLEIKGFSTKVVEKIQESYSKSKVYRELTFLLRNGGVSMNLISLIYNKYGRDSKRIILENPYALAYNIDGIGFKKADKVALAINSNFFHSPERVEAAITFAVREFCDMTGSLYLQLTQIDKKAKEYLNTAPNDSINSHEIDTALMNLCRERKLILREDQFYLAKYYYDERHSVTALIDLINADEQDEIIDFDVEQGIARYEKTKNFQLSDNQKKAVRKSLKSNVSVITGRPGTGKSTVIDAVITIFKELHDRNHKDECVIKPVAPTGIAAQRIEEITGMESSTIHRLLEFQRETKRFKYNQENHVSANMIIADESSMIDISLFRSFITAINPTTKLIIIGDVDQLPSVGAGNVLHDIIFSETVPVTRLNQIFRQEGASQIVTNAAAIIEGKASLDFGKEVEGYLMSPLDSDDYFSEFLLQQYTECKKEYPNTQVITAFKSPKYKLSTTNLNGKLSKIDNPDNQEEVVFAKGNTNFHHNDKVMQIKNNYNKDVFNGETGTLIHTEDETYINFKGKDSEKNVNYANPEEIELAYAITAHKSQGNEYDCVIIPIANSHCFFMDRNLLYTALTRAKKKCVLIFQDKALYSTVSKTQINKRKTNMELDLRVYQNTGMLKEYTQFNEKELKRILNPTM